MQRPVIVTPPEILPVSLLEAKAHLRVDFSDDDSLIEGLIEAATDHLDGWTGILGRCLVEQTWAETLDSGSCALGLGPVIEIVSVEAGGETVDPSLYGLRTDAGGRSYVDCAISGPVTVTYTAGYANTDDDQSTVPAALKAAIMLLVGHWYHNREAVVSSSVSELPLAVASLIAPYRRHTV